MFKTRKDIIVIQTENNIVYRSEGSTIYRSISASISGTTMESKSYGGQVFEG